MTRRATAEETADHDRDLRKHDDAGRSVTVLPPIPHATTNEKLIVGKLVTDLLAAGCLLGVNDGEEITVTDSTDAAAIFAALSSTDEDYLIVRHDELLFGGSGWVRLIWGNDVDVISDYVVRLETLLAGTNALAEELS